MGKGRFRRFVAVVCIHKSGIEKRWEKDIVVNCWLLFIFSHHGFVTTWQGSCNFANCTFAHGEHELRGVSRGSTNKFELLLVVAIHMHKSRTAVVGQGLFSGGVFPWCKPIFHEKMPKLHEWIHRKQMTSIPTQPPNLTQEKGRESWTKMQEYQCKPIEVIWNEITFEAGLLERNGCRPQAKYRQCWLASHRWSVFVFSYFSLFSIIFQSFQFFSGILQKSPTSTGMDFDEIFLQQIPYDLSGQSREDRFEDHGLGQILLLHAAATMKAAAFSEKDTLSLEVVGCLEEIRCSNEKPICQYANNMQIKILNGE